MHLKSVCSADSHGIAIVGDGYAALLLHGSEDAGLAVMTARRSHTTDPVREAHQCVHCFESDYFQPIGFEGCGELWALRRADA